MVGLGKCWLGWGSQVRKRKKNEELMENWGLGFVYILNQGDLIKYEGK